MFHETSVYVIYQSIHKQDSYACQFKYLLVNIRILSPLTNCKVLVFRWKTLVFPQLIIKEASYISYFEEQRDLKTTFSYVTYLYLYKNFIKTIKGHNKYFIVLWRRNIYIYIYIYDFSNECKNIKVIICSNFHNLYLLGYHILKNVKKPC